MTNRDGWTREGFEGISIVLLFPRLVFLSKETCWAWVWKGSGFYIPKRWPSAADSAVFVAEAVGDLKSCFLRPCSKSSANWV